MSVDLNKCSPGDILVSKHGLKLRYVGVSDDNAPYRHEVAYPGGGCGSRTDDGRVFMRKRLPEDHDIVEVIKVIK